MTSAPIAARIGASRRGTAPAPTSPTVRPPISPSDASAPGGSAQPAAVRAAAVELRQAAQRGEHERERHLGDGGGVRAGHVAHRDPVPARRLEVDGVHADADLLHELEARRPGEHLGGDRLQDVEDRRRVGKQRVERRVRGFGDDGDRQAAALPRRELRRQLRPRFAASDDQGFLHHGKGRGGICASLRYSLPVGDLKRVLRGGSAVSAQDELISVLRGLGLVGEAETVRLTPLAGGVSSDIFRVETQARIFALKRALPKLKVAADWQAPVERNAYEVAWIETAAGVVPEAVPEILGHDPGNGLFAMTYLDPATHPVWKAQLRDGIVDAGFAAEVGRRVAAIHAATAADSTVAARFATDRIFRPIRLEPYLEASARRHPGVADRLMTLSRDTLAVKKALVHGDVSPKNILAGPRGPVFLDAECAWYGDPAFDLAFCLNHLLLKCLWNRAAAPAYLGAFDALAAAYLAAVTWEPRAELEARTARLLPGLFLARVDGKSPVEYITDDADRDCVRATALPLIAKPPRTLAAVRSAWAERLGSD